MTESADVHESVEEHLEYLLQEARGKLRWPQEDIESLESDLEAFRELREGADGPRADS